MMKNSTGVHRHIRLPKGARDSVVQGLSTAGLREVHCAVKAKLKHIISKRFVRVLLVQSKLHVGYMRWCHFVINNMM